VKRRIGCAVFLLLGILWLAFVGFDAFVHTYGDCFGDNDLCTQLKRASTGLVMWRGFAVGLLLGIAYAVYRRFFEDEDV
jgi:hypothetical protein